MHSYNQKILILLAVLFFPSFAVCSTENAAPNVALKSDSSKHPNSLTISENKVSELVGFSGFQPPRRRRSLFRKILDFFLDGRTKRKFKEEMKNGTLSDLEKVFRQENKDKLRYQKPATYYLISAIANEAKLYQYGSTFEDTSAYCLDYCVAYKIYVDGNLSTPRDEALFERIESLNEKFGDSLGIKKFGNIVDWTRNKCNDCEKFLEDSEEKGQESVDVINAQERALIDEIDRKLDTIYMLIRNIRNDSIEISKLSDEQESTIQYLKDNGDVQFGIPNSNLRGSALNRLVQLVNNDISESDLTETEKVALGEVYIKSVPNDSLKPNAKRTIFGRGDKIGYHCEAAIRETGRQVVNTLINQIFSLPYYRNFKDYSSIEAVLELKGYADYLGAGRNLGIPFTAERDMDFKYRTNRETIQSFKLAKGRTISITNEQLAFLRAYCAYVEVQRILQDLNITEVRYDFYAIEQSTEAAKSQKEGDRNYRGVDVFFRLNNVFSYLLDHIDQIDLEIQNLKDKMNIGKRRISLIEQQKRKDELQLKKLQVEKRKLEERLLKIKQYKDTWDKRIANEVGAVRLIRATRNRNQSK